MPESGVVKVNLGDNYWLIAAGLKRGKGGELWADLMLENGRILYQDRTTLDTETGRAAWSEKAAQKAGQPDGPTAERMAQAILEYPPARCDPRAARGSAAERNPGRTNGRVVW